MSIKSAKYFISISDIIMTGSEPPPPAGEGLSLLKDFLQQVANINKLEIQKSFLSK